MDDPVLSSIYLVSKLVREKDRQSALVPIASSFLRSPDGASSVICSLRDVSIAVAGQLKDIKAPRESGLEVFKSLGIRYDEVIHSQAIARCFSDSGPQVVLTLLSLFAKQTCGPLDGLEAARFAVSTERSLGSLPNSWKIGPEIQSRRIDVLIEHPRLVLAIENKVESRESERQTKDYFTALEAAFGTKRKILGIFLSPDKLAPGCDSFHAMDYVDLYRIFDQTLAAHENERVGFLRFYAKEVFNIFVRRQRKSHLQTLEYWKGKTA